MLRTQEETMKLRPLGIGMLLGLLVGLPWPFVAHARGQRVAENIAPRLGFVLVSEESIAAPDGRSAIDNLRVLVFREKAQRDQCYVAFVLGAAMSTTGPRACP
jgi:hypothetical protein